MSKRERKQMEAFRETLVQLARTTRKLGSSEKKLLISWLKSANHEELSSLVTDVKDRIKQVIRDAPHLSDTMKAQSIADLDRSSPEGLAWRLIPKPDKQLQSSEAHGMIPTPDGGVIVLIAGLLASLFGAGKPKGPFR